MFIFILIYLLSFIITIKEMFSGNKQGFLLYTIFGLSIYTTAMSVAFMLGLKSFIPFFQSFKELLVISLLAINLVTLKTRPRLHLIDKLILVYMGYMLVYSILPIGTQPLVLRLLSFKLLAFFGLVYFAGRFIDLQRVYVNRYFNYIILLTIAAGAVTVYEETAYDYLQSHIDYADYVYYVMNIEPSGSYGLSTTFESEGGYKRFASFFSNPLEHAAATLIALAVIMALYTRDDNKIRFKPMGITALVASLFSIIFAFSRAAFVSYFFMMYVYARLTGLKTIVRTIHYILAAAAAYVIYLITFYGNAVDGIMAVIINTLNFSNPSSIGHLIEWTQGILSIIQHPLGLGMGATGRVSEIDGGESLGGENQYIIIAVQAGVFAMILYATIYFAMIKQGLKWLNVLKGKERKICLAVLMIKIGFLIPSFTSEFEGSSYLAYINWFLSGLFVSTIVQHRQLNTTMEYADRNNYQEA